MMGGHREIGCTTTASFFAGYCIVVFIKNLLVMGRERCIHLMKGADSTVVLLVHDILDLQLVDLVAGNGLDITEQENLGSTFHLQGHIDGSVRRIQRDAREITNSIEVNSCDGTILVWIADVVNSSNINIKNEIFKWKRRNPHLAAERIQVNGSTERRVHLVDNHRIQSATVTDAVGQIEFGLESPLE